MFDFVCQISAKSAKSSNMLKLSHTRRSLSCSPQNSARDLTGISLIFNGCVMKSVSLVKSLYFDVTFSMDRYVSTVAKSCFFQILNIGRIGHVIDEATCKMLIYSLVT